MKVNLNNPEYNPCDSSIKLSSSNNPNTYAEFDINGKCIVAKYDGIKCIAIVEMYDSKEATISITLSIGFCFKFICKELINKII